MALLRGLILATSALLLVAGAASQSVGRDAEERNVGPGCHVRAGEPYDPSWFEGCENVTCGPERSGHPGPGREWAPCAVPQETSGAPG